MFGRKRAYLDHAASTPALPAAIRAYISAVRLPGNPSSPHDEGQRAQGALEEARRLIARTLSVKTDDVVFTSGATEANNLAIQGCAIAAHARGMEAPRILFLPSAHSSVVRTVESLTAWGITAAPLPIISGAVDIDALSKMLTEEVVLVAMDLVCGETGIVWNTREVSRLLEERKIPLLVDASQAPLTELMERTRIGASILVMDAQKIGGVRGTGVMVASRMLPMTPLMFGGVQERGARPGTESVAGAAAFAIALEHAQHARENRVRAWDDMRTALVAAASSIPNALVNEGKAQSPRIVNFSFPGRDTDYLVALLNEAGYAVSTKSACETDSVLGSRAVMAVWGDDTRAASTLRVSFGPNTTMREVRGLAKALQKAVAFLDESALA